ncbi:hypothetical protein [Natrialba chahannaoensis]|uniref:hypothetical protein n=1 Tax=Natrialba chahannaoensis TaxID=68911 RepID=UPI001F4D12BC|nr:hypothetical protein [Natrialba chahannaoensis]
MTTTATYVGAVILIGFPVATILAAILSSVAETLGLESLATVPGSIPILVVSLVFGLQLAAEATALQLNGIDALGRGLPRIALMRYLVFAVAATSVLIGAVWAGVVLVRTGPLPQAVFGALAGLAALVVLFRASKAFLDGMSSRGYEQDQ